jgi:hypothetical protein
MIDIRQSVQYTDYLKRESWIVERREEINYFIRKFPLIGSILKLQRPEKIDFSTINKLCRKYRVFQVIIEPNLSFHNSLYSNDFRLSKSPYLPSKTLQIDLTQAEEKIYTNFTKDCKYNIRKGEKIKVKEYSTPNDIKKWREAWRSAVKFNRYVPSAMPMVTPFSLRRTILLAVLWEERFSRKLHTALHIIGTDLQIPKVALPYPNTLSSIMEYYGLRRAVVRFLTSKVSMTPASLIKVGLDLLISSILSVEAKFSTLVAIPNLDFRFAKQ